MTTEISEFADAYSDDLIYLQEARKALLTHPFRRETEDLCDASFCRMFAVLMIGSVEHMLQEWQDRDKNKVLGQYSAGGASNKERVCSLHRAFQAAGINVDWDIFADFLAIKYLRNVIVHARWKPSEQEWLDQRSFPTDTRRLTKQHWLKVQHVNQNMMYYIALAGLINHSRRPSDKLLKLKDIAEETDELGLVQRHHIPRMFWRNLEQISARLHKSIERTVLTEQYNWANGLSLDEAKTMSHQDRKRLYYLAARRAGQDSFRLLAQDRNLGTAALESWEEYWRLTFEQARITVLELKTASDTLFELHKRGIYPEGPFVWKREIPNDLAVQFIGSNLKGYSPLSEEQIANALNTGVLAYEFTPNITGTLLLAVQLPIIDPHNTQHYLDEGEKALQAMRVRHYWYSWIEHRRRIDFENLTFYQEMIDEWQG